jgi:hypothetical protein
MLLAGVQPQPLSLDERVARIQRKRLKSAATVAIESFLWFTGAAVVAAIAMAGLTGLR